MQWLSERANQTVGKILQIVNPTPLGVRNINDISYNQKIDSINGYTFAWNRLSECQTDVRYKY